MQDAGSGLSVGDTMYGVVGGSRASPTIRHRDETVAAH